MQTYKNVMGTVMSINFINSSDNYILPFNQKSQILQ